MTVAAYLDRIAPDAASGLREGMEQTLKVTRLRIDPALAIHLVTTNPIESALSTVRKLLESQTLERQCHVAPVVCNGSA